MARGSGGPPLSSNRCSIAPRRPRPRDRMRSPLVNRRQRTQQLTRSKPRYLTLHRAPVSLSSWAVGALALRFGLLGFAASRFGHTAMEFSKRRIGRDARDRCTQLVAETRDHLEFALHHRIKTRFGDIRSAGFVAASQLRIHHIGTFKEIRLRSAWH